MRLGHLSKRGLTELHKRNLFQLKLASSIFVSFLFLGSRLELVL